MRAAPMCFSCKHQKRDSEKCSAFPDGIPEEILLDGYDHRLEYAGDGGIRFAPRDKKAAASVNFIYGETPNPKQPTSPRNRDVLE